MPSGKIVKALAIVLGLLTLSQSAEALSSNESKSEFGSVRLVSAVEATGTLQQIPLGLHVSLPEGWKTYWRSPGDAGLPARIDWSGSANLAAAEIRHKEEHRNLLTSMQESMDVMQKRMGAYTSLASLEMPTNGGGQ